MEIKKYIIALAAVVVFTGTTGLNEAQAQTVEIQENNVSIQIPDRFEKWFNMDNDKQFRHKATNSSENDSNISVEIIHKDDSVKSLIKERAEWVLKPGEITALECLTDANGNAQSYLLYTEKAFGKSDFKGYIFADLGNRAKLKVKFSMPSSEHNQQEFQDMLSSITFVKASAQNNGQKESNSRTIREEHHHGFSFNIGFKIG